MQGNRCKRTRPYCRRRPYCRSSRLSVVTLQRPADALCSSLRGLLPYGRPRGGAPYDRRARGHSRGPPSGTGPHAGTRGGFTQARAWFIYPLSESDAFPAKPLSESGSPFCLGRRREGEGGVLRVTTPDFCDANFGNWIVETTKGLDSDGGNVEITNREFSHLLCFAGRL